MATITKRKTKSGEIRYFVQVRIKNVPAQRKTFSRLADARQWAAKIELNQEQLAAFGDSLIQSHTFSELAQAYLQDFLVDGTAAKKSAETIRIQRRQLAEWRKHLDNYQLQDITPLIIERARSSMRSSTRANPTLNRYLVLLCHIFSRAVEFYGWLRENPCRRVPKYKENQGRTRFLSDAELKRLLDAVDQSTYQPLALITRIALVTGMRRGEILTLTWQQINFDSGLLELLHTKNGDKRFYPLPADLLQLLKQHRQQRERSALLFPSHKNPTKPITMVFPWKAALKQAGINDFRFHDLRHTAASYLAMSGVSLRTIADVLGHKDLRMVMRYSHLSDEHKADALRVLQDKIK